MILTNGELRVEVSEETGALRSLSSYGQEFLVSAHDQLPAFRIQYLDDNGLYHHIDSSSGTCTVEKELEAGRIRFHYRNLGGYRLRATVTVRSLDGGNSCSFNLSIDNEEGLRIADVHFPWVVVKYELGGRPEGNKLLRPYVYGILYQNLKPVHLEPDDPSVWQFTPENGTASHYPGLTFAQFLAYYNDVSGLLIRCTDRSGNLKQIKPVHHRVNGIRLGFCHVIGKSGPGRIELGYDVVITGFKGDWYDAADLYRSWVDEAWNHTPLHKRSDLPKWLEDSPLHVILRIQGQVDEGPAPINPEFIPYENALRVLEAVAEKVGGPLLPIMMSWESPGPWVYPESFPPAGGEENLKRFAQALRAKGWRLGTYCNGTRWVTRHKWTGYDGRERFFKGGGAATACRTADGELWLERWDARWRSSYPTCIGVPETQRIATDYVRKLLEIGFDWIQFFDQNIGAVAFPCFAKDHGHPEMPGRWMTEGICSLISKFDELARESGREIVYSAESAPNEYNMNSFHTCDVRHNPLGAFVPLYHYLFHEYITTHSAFATAANPHWMEIKTVHAFTLGDVPSAILGPGGRFLNWEGYPWATWDTPAGDQEAIVDLLKVTLELRRGRGRPYLVFGRMQRPVSVSGIKTVEWECAGRVYRMNAVFHSKWSSPLGDIGIVLGNWTRETQSLEIQDKNLGPKIEVTVVTPREDAKTREASVNGSLRLTLPGLSVALIEIRR